MRGGPRTSENAVNRAANRPSDKLRSAGSTVVNFSDKIFYGIDRDGDEHSIYELGQS